MSVLQNLPQEALVHHVDRLDRNQVFLDQDVVVHFAHPDVGELERLGQALQAFDRLVVRVADLLVLVWVHLLEGVAKFGFVGVGGHGSVSGVGCVSYDTHEPWKTENIKLGSAQFISFLVGRKVGPCGAETGNWPNDAKNEKTPKRGERRALWGKLLRGLAVGREFTPFGLLEPGVFAFGVNLPEDRRVERGVRCLTAWAGPVLLLGHRVNHLLGVERLFRFSQYLGRGVQGRQTLGGWLFSGLRGLGGSSFRGVLGAGLFRSVSLGRALGSGLLRGHGSSPKSEWLVANRVALTHMSHAIGNTSSAASSNSEDSFSMEIVPCLSV